MDKIETDNGWLLNVTKETVGFDIKHTYVGTIKKGKEISNHYHKLTTERFICLKGIITVKFNSQDGTNEEYFDLEEGDFVDIPTGTIHTLMNITHLDIDEDAVFIGVCSEKFKEGKDKFKGDESD